MEESRYIHNAGLEIMIASEKDQDILWCLKQLLMIRTRRCDHQWEDAVTMSAEGISLRGFRACFRCDKIKAPQRRHH
jgi:hypothetical protein